MPEVQPILTTAGLVYDRLKRDVLTGEFRPGEKLVERDLTERYGVSRTPLREALKELVRSRLATTVPYRGVFVRQVSFKFAREIYEMRAGLDGIAGFHAATRATRAELSKLGEVCERIAAQSKPVEDPDEQQKRRNEILLLNMQFHRIVAEMAHNGVLLEKHDELWSSVSLVRQSVWRTGARTMSSLEEHEEILDALSRRDAERARNLCEKHVERAWSFVSEAARVDPSRNSLVEAPLSSL
jgi:DNA-binding GntR family transcriptional regulator